MPVYESQTALVPLAEIDAFLGEAGKKGWCLCAAIPLGLIPRQPAVQAPPPSRIRPDGIIEVIETPPQPQQVPGALLVFQRQVLTPAEGAQARRKERRRR